MAIINLMAFLAHGITFKNNDYIFLIETTILSSCFYIVVPKTIIFQIIFFFIILTKFVRQAKVLISENNSPFRHHIQCQFI